MSKKEGTAGILRHMEVTLVDNQATAGEKKYKEIFARAKESRNGVCPVRDIMVRISDKWSVLTILLLGGSGKLRFNEILHGIGDVSQRMLTVTLRHLEEDGFVTRKVFAEVPPRVEYELTELGHSLLRQVGILTDWAEANAQQIVNKRKKAVH